MNDHIQHTRKQTNEYNIHNITLTPNTRTTYSTTCNTTSDIECIHSTPKFTSRPTKFNPATNYMRKTCHQQQPKDTL